MKGAGIIKIILLTIIICNWNIVSGQKEYNLLKIGIKGSGGVSWCKNLTNSYDKWIDDWESTTNMQIVNRNILFPIIWDYGFQPYLTITPVRYLQIGGKMDYLYSSHYYNSKFGDTLLKVKIKTYMPCAYLLLTLGKFELGGGLIFGYTSVHWKDDFFGYNDYWQGKRLGYEISMGFSFPLDKKKHFGIGFDMIYRHINFNKLTDGYERTLKVENTNDNYSVNMSGILLNLGIYYHFITINKKKNEDKNPSIL